MVLLLFLMIDKSSGRDVFGTERKSMTHKSTKDCRESVKFLNE